MKALPTFIFGGSATIGVMKAGFEVDKVVELTEDMASKNAYHFAKNYPDIDIVPPSRWERDDPNDMREVMKDLTEGSRPDYIFTNPPCSGLSLVNPNASADADQNKHFMRSAAVIMATEPRTFTLENAPTLVAFGTPVLKKFIDFIREKYRVTIVRDFASNHGVAMKRQRTMLFGWHRDEFAGVPQVMMAKQNEVFLRDVIGDMQPPGKSNVPNHIHDSWHTQVKGWEFDVIGEMGKHVAAIEGDRKTLLRAAVANLDTPVGKMLEEKHPRAFAYAQKQGERWQKKKEADGGIWDKSPGMTEWDGRGASMTSMTRMIHPSKERYFTLREYARLMGYPDDFIFYEGGETRPIVCMAQGVPVEFVNWAASQAKANMESKPRYLSNKDFTFQHHGHEKWNDYTWDELKELDRVETDKKSKPLRDKETTPELCI